MSRVVSICAVLVLAACAGAPLEPPIASGSYIFTHRFFEHPTVQSVTFVAVIEGSHIVLTNLSESSAFPNGVVAEGTLIWHPASKSWIIGHKPEDAQALEVGGCTGGPEVIDLRAHVFWTC
jgi:hypothetical protein